MPRDDSFQTILVLGSGPIVIGQACEFDYSGTQAVKVLASEGYRVVLVNSNPATIMTDPELLEGEGHRTYIEPLTLATLHRIIDRERPDAILPTVGGQTAINLALEAMRAGLLERNHIRLLGAQREALELAEDRLRFKEAMEKIGLEVPQSTLVSSVVEAERAAAQLGYPAIVRASYTLGGMGSGMARDVHELRRIVARGLDLSPVHEVLVEESVLGWHEYELEVMRDRKDQTVVVCSIENLDPMGVHTGDSITVAPAMTLTDREYQRMRDQAFRVIRRVGVETGGSNIQFAVHPESRRMVVIEMNPRVSRSSALASKATGFPIAKIAAKLAVGYALDEIPNDITRKTPACFEPALDYVVVKIPRWNFEKFPGSSRELGTQMKSVGEVMAIGRSFPEALQKGLRSLEMSTSRASSDIEVSIQKLSDAELRDLLVQPRPERIYELREAFRRTGDGLTVAEVAESTGIHPWFLGQIARISREETQIEREGEAGLTAERLREMKALGFSDVRIGQLVEIPESRVRALRAEYEVMPVYQRIDTCAGEFESFTPYLYSTYASQCEADPTDATKALILGGGPIRIGQGIEFDYCACHAAMALREQGIESILINCNPETVSTDYDTADRLYFEPVTLEDVLHVVEREKPGGVIVQFGGQTPLNLAKALQDAGVKILGTPWEMIDLAEDRERFASLLATLAIPHPEMGLARSVDGAKAEAERIGYPVILRPSYVLGGRAMQVVYDEESLEQYAKEAADISPDHPVFLDRFLEDAYEVDVDAVSDGESVVVAGVQQHIEEAGIHSGDSACVLPPYRVEEQYQQQMIDYTIRIARELGVIGLLNVQFAMKDGVVYVIEANPRASRTIPYVSKAIGVPLARLATRVILGEKLRDLVPPEWLEGRAAYDCSVSQRNALGRKEIHKHVFVKVPVFSANRFPDVDTLLGPEMRSTGEVLGIGRTFGEAFVKATAGAGTRLPVRGTVFVSVHDKDKPDTLDLVRDLGSLGFEILATRGTYAFLRQYDLRVGPVFKVKEGEPSVADLIGAGRIQMVVNTPLGRESHYDEKAIRTAALAHGVPCITTLSGARAAVDGIRTLRSGDWDVLSMQELHAVRWVLPEKAGVASETGLGT